MFAATGILVFGMLIPGFSEEFVHVILSYNKEILLNIA
jgi:hypothetical protein